MVLRHIEKTRSGAHIRGSVAADLAILYEHPQWFQSLFAALERRGIHYLPIELAGHGFDPASKTRAAAQSTILRM